MNSDDFVFDNQMLTQIIWFGYTIAEISCLTKYFKDALSINIYRSMTYGSGCIRTVQKFRSQNALSSERREQFGILVPFFKWVNRLYAGIAWLDAKIMPQVFSTVLLMKIEKKR
jgi:hypothetical protein